MAGIPSSYPVLSDPKPPQRILMGPYIASRPAYEMFRSGKPISDLIAEDMAAQAKAEGRPSPVIEQPENAKYWGGGGGGDHDSGFVPTDTPAPAAPLPPVPAPPVAPGLPLLPGVEPAPAAAAPAPAAPTAPPAELPAAAPAPDHESAPLPAALTTDRSTRVAVSQRTTTAPRAGAPNAHRPVPAPRVATAAQKMAKIGYQRASHAVRADSRPIPRRPDAVV